MRVSSRLWMYTVDRVHLVLCFLDNIDRVYAWFADSSAYIWRFLLIFCMHVWIGSVSWVFFRIKARFSLSMIFAQSTVCRYSTPSRNGNRTGISVLTLENWLFGVKSGLLAWDLDLQSLSKRKNLREKQQSSVETQRRGTPYSCVQTR